MRSEQLAIAEDTTIKEDERREAFNKAIAAEEAMYKLRKRANDDLIEQAKKKTEANDTDAEARKALNDLIADGENLEAGFLNAKTLLVKKLNAVKAEAPDTPEREAEKETKRLEGIQIGFDNEMQLIDTSNRQKEFADKVTQDKIAGYREEIRQEEELKRQQDLQNEKILQQQKIAIVGQTFGALADILGENSAAGKAAAIAQATINTYQGITEVWSAKSILPEPFATAAKIASTATVLASGLSAVKSIKSQKLPAGSSGGGISPASAPQLPQSPQFNIVGDTVDNQLETSINAQTQKPIKAFVVSKDVSTAQEMDRNVVSSASFG